MPVIRLSLGKPLRGQEKAVQKLYEEMDEWLSQQPGYILGCHFHAEDGSEEIGRLSLWESHEAADHIAVHPHVLALRSRIHVLLEAGHQERLLRVVGTSHNLPAARAGAQPKPSGERSHPLPGEPKH